MQRTYQLTEAGPSRVEGELAEMLLREGRHHHFRSGATIQQQGDTNDGFWLIKSGNVLLCRFGAEGDMTVYGVLGAGDLFGELAHFSGVSRQVDAVAESAATLVRIDASLIDRLLGQQPQFARWLLKSLANQLRSALDRIEIDRQLSAKARLIKVLVEMVRRDGAQIAITQQGLGDLIGTSRITVGQILRQLEERALVRLEYRQIVVTDLAALAALND